MHAMVGRRVEPGIKQGQLADQLGMNPLLPRQNQPEAGKHENRMKARENERQIDERSEEEIDEAYAERYRLVIMVCGMMHGMVERPQRVHLMGQPVLPVVEKIHQHEAEQCGRPGRGDWPRRQRSSGEEQRGKHRAERDFNQRCRRQAERAGHHPGDARPCKPARPVQPPDLKHQDRRADQKERARKASKDRQQIRRRPLDDGSAQVVKAYAGVFLGHDAAFPYCENERSLLY